MLEAVRIDDMQQHSMDNPYQPPTAPLTAGASDDPVDRSVTVDSPKGPVRLERRGESIALVFNNTANDIPAERFVSAVLMHTTKVRRISFKTIGLYAVTVSDQKFREVLDFYGIDRFKQYDLKSMRWNNGIFGLIFLALATVNGGAWSWYDLGLLCFGLMSIVLCGLTFSRLYLTFWTLSVIAHLQLGITMALLWYTQGDWWVLIVLFFLYFSVSTNLGRLRYFSRLSNMRDPG